MAGSERPTPVPRAPRQGRLAPQHARVPAQRHSPTHVHVLAHVQQAIHELGRELPSLSLSLSLLAFEFVTRALPPLFILVADREPHPCSNRRVSRPSFSLFHSLPLPTFDLYRPLSIFCNLLLRILNVRMARCVPWRREEQKEREKREMQEREREEAEHDTVASRSVRSVCYHPVGRSPP